MSDHHDSPIQASHFPEGSEPLHEKTRKLAHRLNNVLGIIRGNIEMLETEVDLSGKPQLRLEKVNNAIDEATDLVSEIYEFEALIKEYAQQSAQQISAKGLSSGD